MAIHYGDLRVDDLPGLGPDRQGDGKREQFAHLVGLHLVELDVGRFDVLRIQECIVRRPGLAGQPAELTRQSATTDVGHPGRPPKRHSRAEQFSDDLIDLRAALPVRGLEGLRAETLAAPLATVPGNGLVAVPRLVVPALDVELDGGRPVVFAEWVRTADGRGKHAWLDDFGASKF